MVLAACLLLSACAGVVDDSPSGGCVRPTDPACVLQGLERLVVADEVRCAPYDRSDYPYSQSIEDRIIEQLGGIWSPYTGERFSSKHQTDIEHMVAVSEAHDSGLCAADAATKVRYASDLLNLTLASPAVNRSQKGREGRRRVAAAEEPLLVRRPCDCSAREIRADD